MPAPTLNKQPIFTATPLLITKQFDPLIPTTLRNPGMDNATRIYNDSTNYGSLITKVTVVSTGLVGDIVTTKVIYLGIEDVNTNIVSLYQSKIMTGINGLTTTDIVPYVTFTFEGGLVMDPNNGGSLLIAASINRDITGENGDQISVIVEGGTYDQPA
jgi:hypothetical protein